MRTKAFLVLLFALLGSVSKAEVIELDGTIKSVDAEKREIIVGDRTLDVAKKCEIRVDGEEATLADLKSGQEVVVKYDVELEVARAINVGSVEFDAAAMAKLLSVLQGEWLTVAAEENNNKLSSSVVRRQNRRFKIDGTSLVMERVMNGKLGVYSGKFSVDPGTGQFDWIGKGPNGFPVEWIGIFEVGGKEVKLCYRYNNDGTAKRPKDFTTDDWEKPNAMVFYTLKKQE